MWVECGTVQMAYNNFAEGGKNLQATLYTFIQYFIYNFY